MPGLRKSVLGVDQPSREIELMFAGAEESGLDMSTLGDGEPTYEEVPDVRSDRQRQITEFLAPAAAGVLDEELSNPRGDDSWIPTAGDRLRDIQDEEEEWAHLRHIGRDLTQLGQPSSTECGSSSSCDLPRGRD
ncbi:hypothetical protein [Arthrobacter sp. N1]|uniref:hypothetical protein n=1 Tax=Arthrobacter sp. N1 TaxID=619291 RepID=UPI003BAF5923